MSGLSDTSAFEAFNRMAEKIEESERQSVAAAEVNEALEGDTLETEFMRLEAGTGEVGMDDRLLALKQQMGLLPGGSDEPKQLEAGDGDEGQGGESAAAGTPAQGGKVREAEVQEDGAEAGDEVIAEAELLERFKEMEKNAEA
jgi:phage shock protein A